MMTIEVVYVSPTQQYRKILSLPHGTLVQQAWEAFAAELMLEPELLAAQTGPRCAAELAPAAQAPASAQRPTSGHKLTAGIWGHVVEPNTVLQEGDRLELYRSLLLDPKARRLHKVKADHLPRRCR